MSSKNQYTTQTVVFPCIMPMLTLLSSGYIFESSDKEMAKYKLVFHKNKHIEKILWLNKEKLDPYMKANSPT